MRLLITGGAGFIGSNFTRRILLGNFKDITSVIVLDKLTYAGNLMNLDSVKSDRRFNFIEGDICDFNLMRKLAKKVDAIVNFAAESHVDRSIVSSEDFVQTNVVGVRVILDVLAELRSPIRLLQVSTDEVY